jgi:uncharacterized protein (TIGR03382 family)
MRIASLCSPLCLSTCLLLAALAGPAGAYSLIGIAWDTDRGPSVYHLEPAGSDDIDDGSDFQAVRNAFRSWACVPGQSLRFVEGTADGAKAFDLEDGVNSVFWDEDGSMGIGPGTLGVTIFPPGNPDGEPTLVGAADIVFNGFDHEWATRESAVGGGATDVESIALHEAGHWLGLSHPGETPDDPGYLGPDESVMSPGYPGGLERTPYADDVSAIRAIYEADDGSRCEGPYRQGEPCSCDGDCVQGLRCAAMRDGEQLCTRSCSSVDTDCPGTWTCALGPKPADASAPGVCMRDTVDGLRPPGSTCENDRQCAEGLCALAEQVGRNVCRVRCETTEECPDGSRCTQGLCMAPTPEGIECPAEGPPACGCDSTAPGAPLTWPLYAALGGLLWARRGRRLRIAGKRSRTGAAPQV